MDAQHARKENLHRLEKDSMKYTLQAFKVANRSINTKSERHAFLTITHSEKEMEETIKESSVVHALIVKNVMKVEEESSSEVSEYVKEVLEEFKGVLLENLLERLPPLKDIQH